MAFPESLHPYTSNTDDTQTYTIPGASLLYVQFDLYTKVESGYDFIYVMDGSGVNIAGSPFTSTSLQGVTVQVPGNTVQIRLTSDDSVQYYGYKVYNISITEPPPIPTPDYPATLPSQTVSPRVFVGPDGRRWAFATRPSNMANYWKYIRAYYSDDEGKHWSAAADEWYISDAGTQGLRPLVHPTIPNAVAVVNETSTAYRVYVRDFDMVTGTWGSLYGGPCLDSSLQNRAVSRPACGDIISLFTKSNVGHYWARIVPGGQWAELGPAIEVNSEVPRTGTWFNSNYNFAATATSDGYVITGVSLVEPSASGGWSRIYQVTLTPANVASSHFMFRENEATRRYAPSGGFTSIGEEVFAVIYYYDMPSYIPHMGLSHFPQYGAYSDFIWTSPDNYSSAGQIFSLKSKYLFVPMTQGAKLYRWTYVDSTLTAVDDGIDIYKILDYPPYDSSWNFDYMGMTDATHYYVVSHTTLYWDLLVLEGGEPVLVLCRYYAF